MAPNRNQFLNELFHLEYKKLMLAARHLIGDVEVAQDLVQDTFILATIHYEKVKVHPKPEAWLMLTLHNLCRNEKRRQQSHQVYSLSDCKDLPNDERTGSIDELLPVQLSDEDRKILIWRFEQRLEYKEISKMLGISEVGCRSRVSRAVSRCREILGKSEL